jgi:GLPGLI family protein
MKTIKTKLSILILLISFTVNAQSFTGKATYKTSRKSSISFGDDKKSTMSDDMKKQLQARLQKMNQKTFILNFDQKASIYKEDIKLDAPKPQAGGANVVMMSFGGSGNGSVYFKNINEKRFSNQTEIMGKRFLVKDKLPVYEWELSSETKNIGNYTCYKATFTKEVENTNMTFENGESKEVKKKEKITTTAWYTTQIPVSNGPGNYQGLPGLILEINDGKKTIVCTEIILNPSNKIEIEEPKKGKVVSKKKFDKIQKQKSKEMMEKFKSRKGVELGNGINIKMGG